MSLSAGPSLRKHNDYRDAKVIHYLQGYQTVPISTICPYFAVLRLGKY